MFPDKNSLQYICNVSHSYLLLSCSEQLSFSSLKLLLHPLNFRSSLSNYYKSPLTDLSGPSNLSPKLSSPSLPLPDPLPSCGGCTNPWPRHLVWNLWGHAWAFLLPHYLIYLIYGPPSLGHFCLCSSVTLDRPPSFTTVSVRVQLEKQNQWEVLQGIGLYNFATTPTSSYCGGWINSPCKTVII